MIFMGEEFGAETPFLFFCDFEKDLAAAVTAGRRAEFDKFPLFRNPADRERIPDPNAPATFEASRLNWNAIAQPQHEKWLRFYSRLMKLRYEHIVPHLSAPCGLKAKYELQGDRGLSAHWKFADKSELTLLANLGNEPLTGLTPPPLPAIYASEGSVDSLKHGTLPSWSVLWSLIS
jgi:1,4-alpha-glucan branching enzyme